MSTPRQVTDLQDIEGRWHFQPSTYNKQDKISLGNFHKKSFNWKKITISSKFTRTLNPYRSPVGTKYYKKPSHNTYQWHLCGKLIPPHLLACKNYVNRKGKYGRKYMMNSSTPKPTS